MRRPDALGTTSCRVNSGRRHRYDLEEARMTRHRRDRSRYRSSVITGVVVAAVVLALAVTYGTYVVLAFAFGRGP